MPPFYGLPLPAMNFRRYRAFEIHLSSRMLTFHLDMLIFSFINLHANSFLFFHGVTYALERSLRGYMIYQAMQYVVLGSVVIRNVVCDQRYYRIRRSYESSKSSVVRWYTFISTWDNSVTMRYLHWNPRYKINEIKSSFRT